MGVSECVCVNSFQLHVSLTGLSLLPNFFIATLFLSNGFCLSTYWVLSKLWIKKKILCKYQSQKNIMRLVKEKQKRCLKNWVLEVLGGIKLTFSRDLSGFLFYFVPIFTCVSTSNLSIYIYIYIWNWTHLVLCFYTSCDICIT